MTPLYEQHRQLRAKMTDFAGWQLPLYYTSIIEEVSTVRKNAGIFDLFHMGELFISGTHALDLLQLVTTNNVSGLEIEQAQYTLLCNEIGGILDDAIIYRLSSNIYMMVVNAANTQTDFQWISSHNTFSADVEDRSSTIGIIAVQGPASAALLASLMDFNPGTLKRFHVRKGMIDDTDIWIAATGYTGGAGFEIYYSSKDAVKLWTLLLESGSDLGIQPIGLGARDVLRIEAGYPLYDHELSTEVTPVEADLLWVVKPDKGEFIGRSAIMERIKAGPERKLIGIEASDRCIPREGYPVVYQSNKIGEVTSGTFSPTLQKGIAMAYVKTGYAELGMNLGIEVRGAICPCVTSQRPFYMPQIV